MTMTDLNGYFDDSGDNSLPALSIAGYVGTERLWQCFELQWTKALTKNAIPYFHMKEIPRPGSPLHKFNGKENAKALGVLLADLASALNSCWSLREFAAIGCLVPIDELKRFNAERGRSVEAIPLAIFTCDIIMQDYFKGKTIAAMLDRISKPDRAIQIAKEYLASSPVMKGKPDLSSLFPAKENESAKTIKPLQAADFASYEVRRKWERLAPFFNEVDLSHVENNEQLRFEYDDWLERSGLTWPDERKSLTSLGDATTFRCPIWTYQVLCDEDDKRCGRWSC
ncbi:hypothetical protein Q2941_34670 [Bradyrhizobium sp. UFLA05-153]